MTVEVEVQRAADASDLPSEDQIDDWVNAAWQRPESSAGVVIRIVDEEEGRRLNAEFRHKDAATNVLSFAYEPVPGMVPPHVGDLVICAPVVTREAAEQGKTVTAHWAHMVVHGMLHLQGFDHADDTEADRMESLETLILESLGFPAPYEQNEMQ